MVELAEMIHQLRSELARAMADGENEELRFVLGPIELELSVSVQREVAGSGKVKFWVAELGTDTRRDDIATQTLRLTLEARRGALDPTVVTIAGDSVPEER
ncbi:trypco2 family protein [Streptomyces sp. HPF1205]|uniref:trypco2 family protein n=1 Tax=Streptomyces sp. HPF1205 TaxID=2873262 RepID=UPI001CED9FAA|nr:trypco2 family protein [Streptomyces sp. HPF1205]